MAQNNEKLFDPVELMAREALSLLVNDEGLEGAEEKIKEICSSPSMIGLKVYYLNLYDKIYKTNLPYWRKKI